MKNSFRYFMNTLVALVLLLTGPNNTAYADIANSGNSQLYYQIGGARSISAPLNVDANSLPLSGSTEFGYGYSCGSFNTIGGVTNILNNLVDNIITGVTGAITSAISSLPMLILQRVNPGLYDLVQGYIIKAEAIIALANKTCEQYESDIRQGENPYSEWGDVAKNLDWKIEMRKAKSGGDTDVYQAKKSVEKDNGENGIPWLEGNTAGGISGEAIKPTEDIVKAGYNLSLNRNANNNSPAPEASENRLSAVWSSPDEASSWAVDVLGDTHIRTHDDRPIETRPGHGLAPKIEIEREVVYENIEKLVNSEIEPSIDNTSEASSDALLINYDLIKAIQNLEPSEKSIAINNLASEVAMSRTLEKALFVRRLLLTGTREPNVSQVPQAIAYAKDAVDTINTEIDNILFEKRVRSELSSKTASIILSLQEQSERRGKANMKEPGYDRTPIKEGATEE
jgi:integrating conjugative element protein (TIGR03755 family)